MIKNKAARDREIAVKIERARQLSTDADRRAALHWLKAAVRDEPDALQLRLALAELYRALGCPDQAGRWGIAIDGWTSPVEKDRLARLLASSGVATEDMAEFLLLEEPTERFTDASAVVAGPVAAYRDRYAMEPVPSRRERWTDRAGLVALVAWLATLAMWLIGMMAVFTVAALELTDARTFAQSVATYVFAAGALSFLATSFAFAVGRRPGVAVACGFGGIVCGVLAAGFLIRG